jgi:hypothetical protein
MYSAQAIELGRGDLALTCGATKSRLRRDVRDPHPLDLFRALENDCHGAFKKP